MASKGFLGSLFDFSFENFVFPKIVKFLYALIVVIAGLGYIAMVIYGFQQGTTTGFGALLLGPLALTLYLIMIRAWMEVAIVLFRIYENTNVIAGK